MKHSLVLDTLACANKLKNVGIPDKQAEVQVEILTEITDNLATKNDLKNLELALKKDFEGLRKDFEGFKLTTKNDFKELEVTTEKKFKETEHKLKELELRMTIKLGSITVGGMGFIVMVLKVFSLT